MKKRRHILSAAVSLTAVAAILLLFIDIAKPGGTQEETPGKSTIDFTPDSQNADEFVAVAENARFALSANLKQGAVRLLDKAGGVTWSSSPDGYDADPDLKGAAKVALGSPLNIEYADRDSNTTAQNARAGSILKNKMKAEIIGGGVRFTFDFDKEGFLIPLEITLSDTGLNVRVPVGDIREADDQLKLTSITPLPNFGAAGAQENGYFLVPDGSGALIDFNQGGQYEEYSQDIYGSDLSVVEELKSQKTETARLPVFGIKKGNAAFLSIVTQGAARAKVNAAVVSARSPYNTGNITFTYRDSATVEVSQKTFDTTKVNLFEAEPTALDSFSEEYRFLNGDDANYTGMAHAYRQYLMSEAGVTKTAEADSSPLTVDVIGGVMRQESVLGIPVRKVVAITSYADVKSLAQAFLDGGVNDVTFRYLDWSNGGNEHHIPAALSAESGLGGSGKLQSTLKWLDQNHMRMFLDVDLTDMQKSTWEYSTNYDSAKSVQKEPAIQYQYKMSTFRKDLTATATFLLSPNKLLAASTATAKRASAYDFAGFSAGTLSQKLYSDFGDRHLDRGSAEKVWRDSLAQLKGAKGSLLASDANAYAFPYATELTDVPVATSDFLLQSEAVPFYQIALHGLLPMTTTSVNCAEDSRDCVLKAVETGSNLKFTLGWRNIDKLTGTDAADLYDIDASVWTRQAIDDYGEVAGVIAKFSDQMIQNHEKLADGVYRTTFENGGAVIVNYNRTAVTAGRVTVGAQDFAVIGE